MSTLALTGNSKQKRTILNLVSVVLILAQIVVLYFKGLELFQVIYDISNLAGYCKAFAYSFVLLLPIFAAVCLFIMSSTLKNIDETTLMISYSGSKIQKQMLTTLLQSIGGCLIMLWLFVLFVNYAWLITPFPAAFTSEVAAAGQTYFKLYGAIENVVVVLLFGCIGMACMIIAGRLNPDKSLETAQRRYGYYFCIPFIVGGLVFVLFPTIESIIYSLSTVSFDPDKGLVSNEWGLMNYEEIWMIQTSFKEKIFASLQSMVTNVPIVVIFAFFMASVLNTKFIGRGFARSVMFLPVIISSGIILSLANGDMASNLISSGDRFAATSGDTFEVTTAFQIMLEDMNLNQTLVKFIVDSVANISNIVNMSAVSIVIFIAGLQGISPSIYEASYIEGATKWEVFWKISLPMVSPLILTSVVYTIVDNFCGQNNSVVSTIHSTITKTEYDIASAMAVSYSLIIIVILMVVFAVLSKVVFYQD